MATAASFALAPTGAMHRTLRLYAREIRYELIRSARNRAFALSVLGFPVLFYLLFGVANRGDTLRDGFGVARYLLASYVVFGLVGAALFGIGVGLALERSSGWLELKRASPMPPLAYLVARCVVAMTFSVIILCVLSLIGICFADVHLGVAVFGRMLLVTLAGSVPFAGLGLLLATLLPANAAPGIANMIYLPMSYCSGLWIPFTLLPHWVQRFAPWLPSYHLVRLMLHAAGNTQPGDSVLHHVLALVGFAAVFLLAASVGFTRADDQA